MRADLQEPFGEKELLVHCEDDDLQAWVFFQQIGREAEGFRMGHVNVEDEKVKSCGLHLLDYRFSVFGLVYGNIPDGTIDQELQPRSDDRMVVCDENMLHFLGIGNQI